MSKEEILANARTFYAEFNKKAFESLLPEEPPVFIHTIRRRMFRRIRGRRYRVSYRRVINLAYYNVKSKRIGIYSDYKPGDEFKEVILHEMVHMQMYRLHENLSHTLAFWRMLKRKCEVAGIIPTRKLWWS